ncbi:MAG: methionine adenosyltransferase [Promethearchaeia archaeon]
MTVHNYITAESVTEGHPDKICDQISDAILDAFLEQDPTAHVACETFVTTGLVLLGGEISAKKEVDVNFDKIVRNTIKEIGYTDPSFGFDYRSCAVINMLHEQSSDIKQGIKGEKVEKIGAGDQGIMVGYATNETPEMIPLPAKLSHQLVESLAEARKKQIIPFIRPDGKSLVSLEYHNGRATRAQAIIIAAQHNEDVSNETIDKEIRHKIINHVVPARLIDENTKIYINRTGRFVIGGPHGDSGLTGRKIIVDSYGVWNHGGGAYSGKDPTKVDRSGAYMARYAAKNVVAAGLADECEIRLSYVIGHPNPLSINMNCQGTEKIPLEELYNRVLDTFSFRPGVIIRELDLRRPIYEKTAAYGHFGRDDPDFTWEKTDKMEALKG